MTINRDEFFREVTLRICSSLDIGVAVKRAFDYLREHFPLDEIYLDKYPPLSGSYPKLSVSKCFFRFNYYLLLSAVFSCAPSCSKKTAPASLTC